MDRRTLVAGLIAAAVTFVVGGLALGTAGFFLFKGRPAPPILGAVGPALGMGKAPVAKKDPLLWGTSELVADLKARGLVFSHVRVSERSWLVPSNGGKVPHDVIDKMEPDIRAHPEGAVIIQHRINEEFADRDAHVYQRDQKRPAVAWGPFLITGGDDNTVRRIRALLPD